jgi:hypothetical protein
MQAWDGLNPGWQVALVPAAAAAAAAAAAKAEAAGHEVECVMRCNLHTLSLADESRWQWRQHSMHSKAHHAQDAHALKLGLAST